MILPTNFLYGEKAERFMSDIKFNCNVYIISYIKDILYSGESLGSIVFVPEKQIVLSNKTIYSKTFTDKQLNIKMIGSFIFFGNNMKFFSHLINPIIMGKYKKDSIIIDNRYSGTVSIEMNKTLSHYLIEKGNIFNEQIKRQQCELQKNTSIIG